MANTQVNLSFLENGRGGLYMYLLHARYKFSVRTRYNPRTYCTIFYAVYVSTIILLLWYWIMEWWSEYKYLLNIILLSNNLRSSTWRKNLSSIYMYTYNGKNKKYIYQCNKFLTQVAIYKVLLPMLFVKKNRL